MRHNRRPPIATRTIAPNRVSLYQGERPQVACPWCDRWRLLERGMLRPHRRGDGKARCPGSGQRIRIDETEQQWLNRLGKARYRAGEVPAWVGHAATRSSSSEGGPGGAGASGGDRGGVPGRG